jgi:heme/copper-type cytochrome/quinol oxidase subunit 2
MLPILLETTLSYITILGNTVGIVFGIIPALALYNLNTKNPKAYENAKFKLPIFAMKLLPVLALAIYVYGAYLSFDGFIRQEHIVVFLVYSIAAVAYAFWRERRVHEVTKA